MGKTVFICRNDQGNPVLDSVHVYLENVSDPLNLLIGYIPNNTANQGIRYWDNLSQSDYNLYYGNVKQENVSPIFIPGGINTEDIGDQAVTTPKIAGYAVTNAKIANGAITTNKLASGSVTNAKLATNSVKSDNIEDGSITFAKLASGAITGDLIPAGSIVKVKIGTGVFHPQRMAYLNNAGYYLNIDTNKFSYNNSGQLCLGSKVIDVGDIQDGAITEDKIANGGITLDKLAEGGIPGSKIIDGGITSDKIADGGITLDKLADGSLTAIKIADGAITADKLDPDALPDLQRLPSNVAFVSPQFAGNLAPYFDNVDDAITYVENELGTVYVYPGTYTGGLILESSVSLIGMDKTKCIIQHTPTAVWPAAISVDAIGAGDILISNLTIQSYSDNLVGTESIALRVNNISQRKVRVENCLIKSIGNSSSSPQIGVAVDLINANIKLDNCYIESIGGSHTANGTGKNGIGIRVNDEGIGNLTCYQLKLSATGGSGGVSGLGIGFKFEDSPTAVRIDSCVLTASDKVFIAENEIAPLVMNTAYKVAIIQDDKIDTTDFVGSVQNGNVSIMQEL